MGLGAGEVLKRAAGDSAGTTRKSCKPMPSRTDIFVPPRNRTWLIREPGEVVHHHIGIVGQRSRSGPNRIRPRR